MRFLLALVSFILAQAVDAADAKSKTPRFLQPTSLSGSIFPKSPTNAPALFTFRRTARLEGPSIIASREYLARDGTVAANETVQYEGDQLRRFVLEENQINARGSATFETTAGGRTLIRFEYETSSGTQRKKKSETETQSDVVLINDMIPGFITDHWQALTSGQSLRFRYAIIPRLETIAFTLRKIGQSEFSGRPVVEMQMRPASRLLQNFVDPIMFSAELNTPHRILRYIGRTAPKVRHGRNWDDLDAVTIFDWKSATGIE